MRQRGGDPDLSEKAIRAQGGREVGSQDLHGYPPVMPEVLGEIDRGHPAAPKLVLDGVAVSESVSQLINGVGHVLRS